MYFVDSLKRWFFSNNSAAAGNGARIPLLDANGVAVGSDTYNAISEIVRQELGKILNGGTAQTTGITKIPSMVNNNLGATTIANLASVLGAHITNKKATVGMDANNFELGTAYSLNAGINVSHKPPFTSRAVVYTYGIAGQEAYSRWQLAFGADNERAVREYDSQGWHDWMVFPAFYKNYASLTNLSDALNAFRGVDLPQAGSNLVDWDTVKSWDFCWIATWYNDMNALTNPSAGVMICFINQSLPQSDQFRKLYIKLPYTGGFYHSYDLETWV